MMAMDSGMLVVLIIVAMYMSIVFMLLFFVKNEWCDILNSNLTVSGKWFEKIFNGKKMSAGKPGMQTRILHQENIHVPDGRQLIQSKCNTSKHFIFSVTFQNKSTF